MNKKFSIIGCQHEHITKFIHEMIELGYECAGLYDSQPNAMIEGISGKFKIPVVKDMELLLAPEVEIVGSSAMNSEKIGIIEICEKYGKHIMLDKPITTNRNGYDRLKAVIERGKIQVGLLLAARFSPAIYTLKNEIDRGTLGQIVNIGMRKPHRLNAGKRPSWFFSREQCGSIVIDLFIHDFDLLRWLTGSEIASMDGFMGKNILPEYPDFFDTACMQVIMQNDVIAQLYADWHTPDKSWTWGDCRIFVAGTKGTAELRLQGDPMISERPFMLTVTNQESQAIVELTKPSFTISEDFRNRIHGKQSLITHKDILLATEATIVADEKVKIVGSHSKSL